MMRMKLASRQSPDARPGFRAACDYTRQGSCHVSRTL